MSRWRVIPLFLLAGLGLGLLFLQTPSGFAAVVLPLANRFAPGTIDAARGRIGLGGTFEADALRFEAPELGVRVSIRELRVEVALTSLLGGPGPRVDDLRLHGAEIDVRPPAEDGEPGEEPEPPTADPFERLVLPVSVARAEIRDVRLRLFEQEVAWAEAHAESLDVEGLLPDATGRVSGSASARVAPPGEDEAFSSRASLEAELGRRGDGSLEAWQVSVVADFADPAAATQDRFTLAATGSFSGAREAGASLRVRAERGDELLGAVRGAAAIAPGPAGGLALTASAELESLGEGFLNPILAPFRRGLVDRAHISGKLDLNADLPLEPGTLPRLVRGELVVDPLVYRTLHVSELHLAVDATPEKLELRLDRARINRGRLSARVTRRVEEAGEQLEAELRAQSLDLTAVATAFREELPARVEGVLDLTATLASSAPSGADLRETAGGRVRTRLRRGRIEGFNLMSFLAQQSGVEAFKAIPIDDFDVDSDARIERGVAHLHEDDLKSAAAEIVVNGTVALTGSAELTLEAFVGPSVSGALANVGLDWSALRKYERMTALPVAIRVSGPFENLSYGPTAPRTAQRTGEAAESASDEVDKAVQGVRDWFK